MSYCQQSFLSIQMKKNVNVELNDDIENELMNYLLAEGLIGAQKII
jgi:hypothetical protein